MPDISIVIPTYNRLGQLKTVVAALEVQSYPLDRLEVLIVSDGSSDGTDEYLTGYHKPLNLKPFFQKNQGPAAARNLGAFHAAGKIVLFLDDDVVPTRDLIQEHLKVHETYGDNVTVLGPMLAPSDVRLSTWVNWESTMLEKQYAELSSGAWKPSARHWYTGNSSLARHHIIDSGGFDTSFRRAEDVELAYRLELNGIQFAFNPNAIGYHYAERSFESWSKTAYDYGCNDVAFHQQKGYDWILPTIYSEYIKRQRSVKVLIQLCLDRPTLSKTMVNIFKYIALASHRMQRPTVSNAACSGIFNLRYYQGVSDHIGGRRIFFEEVSQPKHP